MKIDKARKMAETLRAEALTQFQDIGLSKLPAAMMIIADTIDDLADQTAAATEQTDVTRRALRLSIKNQSNDPQQIERLEQRYLDEARGLQQDKKGRE